MVNSSKTAISVVISFLVVTLMFSSFSWFEAFAAPKDPNWGKKGQCENNEDSSKTRCCWTVGKVTFCQTCRTDVVATGANCGPVQSAKVAPTPEDQQEATKQPLDNKPSKPNLPKGGSVLEQPQTGESSLQIR